MTTLAARIKSLRAKSLARDVSDKKRASLVFDSKEAAMFDRDEVFNYGVSGFQQLVERDRNFEKFEKTLFCQSLMKLERTGMNREENEQLNEVISDFLMTVSPFFLVKAAQLSLDWLIYRFHIHQMNVDEFVLCILPHHDHEMFPRALQLIQLDDGNGRWHFLHDCAKNNVPLPRRALINQAKRAPGFLRFMCEKLTVRIEKFGPDNITTHQSLLFYRTLMAGVLEKRIELNEDLVKTVMDYVCRGVTSQCHKQKLVNYATLAQLAELVTLAPRKLLKLIDVLLKNIEPTICKQAMCCLVSVLVSQKIKQIPDKTSALFSSALLDLPDDELSSALNKKLTHLVAPPDEEEVMSVDEVDPLSRLLDDLGHKKSSRRVAAVRHLSSLIDEGIQEFSVELIGDALLNRLLDDDHKVVRAVLELERKLVKHTSAGKLLMSLVDLVEQRYNHHKWRAEVELAVKLICSKDVYHEMPGLTVTILGWLLVSNDDVPSQNATLVLKSIMANKDRILGLLSVGDLCKALDGALLEGSDDAVRTTHLMQYNWVLVSSLANLLAELKEIDFQYTLTELLQLSHSESGRGLFVLVSSLSVALSVVTGDADAVKDKQLMIALHLLGLLESIQIQSPPDNGDNVDCLEEGLMVELVPWLTCLRKTHRVPVELVQWSLIQLILALKSYKVPDNAVIVDRSHPLVSVLGKVLEVISCSSGKVWLQLRRRLEQDLDRTSLFKILMMILSELFDREGRDPKWVPHGVYLISFEMIQSICSEDMTIESLMSLSVLPALVMSLHSAHQDVRIGAVRCLQKIHKTCRLSEGLQHGDNLKRLLKKKHVVMVDREYASEVAYEFYRALPSIEIQRSFVSQMIGLGLQSADHFVANAVKYCLQKLELSGKDISHELALPDDGDVSVSKNKGKKKARVMTMLSATVYRRLVLVLEILETRKKLDDAIETTNLLFKLLSQLVHEEGEKSDHCQQLTLACLAKICKRWKSSDLAALKGSLCKANLDVESLRLCISDSANPQIQQLALTILAAIAPLHPEYVMENAIPIFTFMGTNLIQLDNGHTFQVVVTVIDAFMTAIVESLETSKKSTDSGVIVDLMRIFVDVRHQIPCHRKLPLFRHLIERVGVETHLCSLVILIMESSVRKPDASESAVDNQDKKPEMLTLIDKDVELVVDVCAQFTVNAQLLAVTQTISFLQKLLTAHNQGLSSLVEKRSLKKLPIVDATTMNPMRMRLLLVHLSATVVKILDRKELIVEVLKRAECQKLEPVLEGLLRDLVLESLAYLSEATRQQSGSHANTCSPRFWVKLLGNVSKILNKVTYLLPTASFLEVMQSLLDHEILSIKLRALEILASKICPVIVDDRLDTSTRVSSVNLANLSAEEVLSVEKLISKLIRIVKEPTTDQISCHQNTLYCLQLLCYQIGKERPQLFTAVVPVVIRIVATPDVQPLLLDNALTCVAVFCRTLGSRLLLKHLNDLMSPVLSLLANTEFLLSHETTLICLLTCVDKIIACFAEMLDNYLPRLLGFVCLFPVMLTKSVTFKKQAMIEKLLNSMINQIATSLESRVLLPKAKQTFSELLETNQEGLSKFFEVIRLHIGANGSKLSKDSDDLVLLVDVFDIAMNLRSTANQLTWEDMETTEMAMINAIVAMVLSLTDKQFLSIYLKLFSFAGDNVSERQHDRQLTFFKLTNCLAAKLQELFIQYAGHVLKAASDFLNESLNVVTWFTGDDAVRKTCLMLECVIGSIHKCLVFDKDGSFGVKAASKLANSIVDQLENFVGGEEEYKKRAVELVVPCIGQLIIAAKKTGTWKDVSYRICLKSQSVNPVIKIATLLAIEEMARKLGPEYDTLLPETTPFLAELLEDDDAEVIKECHRVKGTIEEVIGESLTECFQ